MTIETLNYLFLLAREVLDAQASNCFRDIDKWRQIYPQKQKFRYNQRD
jgi:hypothetical protein